MILEERVDIKSLVVKKYSSPTENHQVGSPHHGLIRPVTPVDGLHTKLAAHTFHIFRHRLYTHLGHMPTKLFEHCAEDRVIPDIPLTKRSS